jgi:hypothetical protein
MKDYDINNIVRDVRITIDQNMSESALAGFGDTDTLALDDIIKSKIVDAAMLIFDNAPINMIGDAALCKNAMVIYKKVYNSDKSYYAEIAVPSTFYRLVSFKMNGWKKSITDEDLIYPTDEEYAVQRSRIEGVRGCSERPILAYVPNIDEGDNEYCFEAYSCTNNDPYAFTYLPLPMITDDNKISLPQELYKSIVYATAYLTAIAFNSDNQAMRLLSVAKQLAKIGDSIQQQPIVPQYDNSQNVQQ